MGWHPAPLQGRQPSLGGTSLPAELASRNLPHSLLQASAVLRAGDTQVCTRGFFLARVQRLGKDKRQETDDPTACDTRGGSDFYRRLCWQLGTQVRNGRSPTEQEELARAGHVITRRQPGKQDSTEPERGSGAEGCRSSSVGGQSPESRLCAGRNPSRGVSASTGREESSPRRSSESGSGHQLEPKGDLRAGTLLCPVNSRALLVGFQTSAPLGALIVGHWEV